MKTKESSCQTCRGYAHKNDWSYCQTCKPHPDKFAALQKSHSELLKMLKTVHREGAGMHYEAIGELISAAEQLEAKP